MREVPLSNCERDFILKAVSQRKRLDGREAYDYRRIKISFGLDRGCCNVELGNTRVMTQVSCEVTPPKQTRPSEGFLFVNVELSPMAAPQFEGRQSDQSVELNRLLERCLKESRCVDTESLCIMAGIKVWRIRVDVHVLNHDGNLIDAASIAAITALAHFRRPDVTVSGEDVTIHSLEDKDPVPLSVHHMPICVTFAFFEQGKYLLVDPIEREERVMEGKMVIGMNKHREICTLQMTGSMLLLKDQVLRCSNIAVVKVTEMTELIQKALENDTRARAAGEKFGFAASVEPRKVTTSQAGPGQPVDAEVLRLKAQEIIENGREEATVEDSMSGLSVSEGDSSDSDTKVKKLAPGTAMIGTGGPSTWLVDDDDEEEEEEMETQVIHLPHQHQQQQKQKAEPTTVVLLSDDDDSEEEVVMLDDEDLGMMSKHRKHGDQIDLTVALNKKSQHKETAAKTRKKKS